MTTRKTQYYVRVGKCWILDETVGGFEIITDRDAALPFKSEKAAMDCADYTGGQVVAVETAVTERVVPPPVHEGASA